MMNTINYRKENELWNCINKTSIQWMPNGSLLLQTCNQNELAITNTYFQQANKYKTTWQHPRSKHWHMLDYVITRQSSQKPWGGAYYPSYAWYLLLVGSSPCAQCGRSQFVSSSYIRLLIITMTERIMHSEKKHAEHIKQTRKMNNNWY